jgi:hypothetical protein
VWPDMGQIEKERGESHKWAVEPVTVHNNSPINIIKCITTVGLK